MCLQYLLDPLRQNLVAVSVFHVRGDQIEWKRTRARARVCARACVCVLCVCAYVFAVCACACVCVVCVRVCVCSVRVCVHVRVGWVGGSARVRVCVCGGCLCVDLGRGLIPPGFPFTLVFALCVTGANEWLVRGGRSGRVVRQKGKNSKHPTRRDEFTGFTEKLDQFVGFCSASRSCLFPTHCTGIQPC